MVPCIEWNCGLFSKWKACIFTLLACEGKVMLKSSEHLQTHLGAPRVPTDSL